MSSESQIQFFKSPNQTMNQIATNRQEHKGLILCS